MGAVGRPPAPLRYNWKHSNDYTMNRPLIVTLLSILALLAVFGRRAVSSHLVTLKQEARETVRDATPGGHEKKRIQVLIEQASRDVLAYGDKIGDIESMVGAQRADIRKLEERLAADRADLLAERNLLAQTGSDFVIRGARYTRSQIEASAQARLARMRADESTVDAKKKSVEGLEAAIREGRARLQEAIAARDHKVQELELLSADLSNAELQRELASLADPLRQGIHLGKGTELAESMKSFANRVRAVQRQVQATSASTMEPSLIAHGSTTAGPGLVEQIDRALGTSSAAPVSHTPTVITNGPAAVLDGPRP